MQHADVIDSAVQLALITAPILYRLDLLKVVTISNVKVIVIFSNKYRIIFE